MKSILTVVCILWTYQQSNHKTLNFWHPFFWRMSTFLKWHCILKENNSNKFNNLKKQLFVWHSTQYEESTKSQDLWGLKKDCNGTEHVLWFWKKIVHAIFTNVELRLQIYSIVFQQPEIKIGISSIYEW